MKEQILKCFMGLVAFLLIWIFIASLAGAFMLITQGILLESWDKVIKGSLIFSFWGAFYTINNSDEN